METGEVQGDDGRGGVSSKVNVGGKRGREVR